MVTKVDSIIIQRLDGTQYVLENENIRVISFDVPSPAYQSNYTQLSSYRSVRTGLTLSQLVIPLSFNSYARDYYDYELQRLKVMRIFDSSEDFYVYTTRLPEIRWRVRADSFSYQRIINSLIAKVSINLVCADGSGESIATTLDPQTTDENVWGFGLNMPYQEEPKYNFTNPTNNRCKVWNASTIRLNAEEFPVQINFSGVVSSELTIINHTTNQTFTFKKTLAKSDDLIVYGAKPILNGSLAYQYGNHEFIDFAKGYNDIEIKGASNYSISFDMRFRY